MNKENRFVIQVDPLEIEDDAIFDNKELKLYECQSDMMSDICSLLNKQDQRIADLEAKLAESEKQRQHLKDWLDNEILTSVDNESYYATINEYEEEVKKLKQQLAEKDEEIAYLTKQVKKFNNEAQKYFEDAYCNDFHNQDKISFALEQLEQIRKEFEIKFKGCKWEDKMLVGKFCNITNETIDNQINVLRNNKDGIH